MLPQAFETDLFPLALDDHDVDVRVGCNIAAAAAADSVLPQLIGMVTLDKEPLPLWLAQLASRVQLDHMIAATITAPQLSFVYSRHRGVELGSAIALDAVACRRRMPWRRLVR